MSPDIQSTDPKKLALPEFEPDNAPRAGFITFNQHLVVIFLRLDRNRSESPSPMTNSNLSQSSNRRAGVLSPVSPYYARERCYSLGSTPETPPPRLKASPYFNRGRTRQCSCGSQTDLNSLDSDRGRVPDTNSLIYLHKLTY